VDNLKDRPITVPDGDIAICQREIAIWNRNRTIERGQSTVGYNNLL
jgi:hypothetical protein